MKMNRRWVLKGIGGALLGLPWLESVRPRSAWAQASSAPPFAIFFRQANGVAAEQDTNEVGREPERFWPTAPGPLSASTLADRALAELAAYADRLLVVGNVNMANFNYGDGHARGALQLLTARGPVEESQGGNSEANGESLDHRIGRELNAGGNESLFLYAGQTGGWLGGPCISYRGAGNRRSAITDPFDAYQSLTGGAAQSSTDQPSKRSLRQRSINDLVRSQLSGLLARPELSSTDRQRLDLHLSSVRDVEVSLACRIDEAQQRALQGVGDGLDDGDNVLATARLHMDVAALAVACGQTRSVAIQVGSGNDNSTRYRDPVTGNRMENYHFISHRRQSDGDSGDIIQGSDLLHHRIDQQFAQTFKHLLDKLAAYQLPTGSLLDAGMAIWVNDLGNGPAHGARNCPVIIAGSAGGVLRQGEYVRINGDSDEPNHARVLNTIGSAAGLRRPDGNFIDDFGSPDQDRQVLDELLA
ncbi:MAG: hypothetical protein RL033_7807 [Pseudomonadota bacterium]